MNRPNPIGHFTFYRFCVFLANWRMHWCRDQSASYWMNRRIISISSTSSRSWISWRASVIPWLRLCMTWISQRCIVIDWSRYRVGRWAEEAPDTGFYQKALWCGLWDPLWGGWKDEYRPYPAALEEVKNACDDDSSCNQKSRTSVTCLLFWFVMLFWCKAALLLRVNSNHGGHDPSTLPCHPILTEGKYHEVIIGFHMIPFDKV